jgi:hypothetical protein
MNITNFGICLLLSLPILTASAQDENRDSSTSRVEVSSQKGLELKSYSQMQKGLKAYAEYNKLAPNSELFFILIPRSKKQSLEGVTMRLASDETSINIPIDADGKFQLPDIALKHEDEYDLILNKPKGQFYFKPYVKSANLSDDVKRLGDLRLECQVRWAVEKQDVSIVFSAHVNLFASGNPCTSRAVNVMYFAPSSISKVILNSSASTLEKKIDSKGQYSLPIWDTRIIDDALINYERSMLATSKQEN